jgi:hypothetical protein
MNPKHGAFAAAREFSKNVLGDCRILRRELQNDDESKIALEETAHFLAQLAQEMLAGVAPQPERPGASLSDLGLRAPEPTAAPQPQDEQSAAAALLAKLGAV